MGLWSVLIRGALDIGLREWGRDFECFEEFGLIFFVTWGDAAMI